MHRQFSFMPGSLKRFITKYKITFDYLQVPPHMICRKQDHYGQKFFILTYRRPDGKILKMPYSQGAAVKDWPTIERSLYSLGADVMMYLGYDSVESFAQAFQFDPDDDAEDQWDTLKRITEDIRSFLGQEGFEEFIGMAQKNFEMGSFTLGGDRVWLRQGTCG